MTGLSPDALRVSTLSKSAPTAFEMRPDAAALSEIAAQLDLIALRKLSFSGTLRADGRDEWLLEGMLGATVVQPCCVTLAPVTTRIDQKVLRRFTPHMPDELVDEEEVEMPEDDTLEPLGSHIDPSLVMEEALALALPLYPRAEGAGLSDATFAEPGVQPMSDNDVKPFAGLAGLMARSEKSEDDDA